MQSLFVSRIGLALATLSLAACNPTEEDFANARKLADYETQQAEIISKNAPDCAAIESELRRHRADSKSETDKVNAWWDGLGKGKREKLAEITKASAYRLAAAMMKAPRCMDAIKKASSD